MTRRISMEITPLLILSKVYHYHFKNLCPAICGLSGKQVNKFSRILSITNPDRVNTEDERRRMRERLGARVLTRPWGDATVSSGKGYCAVRGSGFGSGSGSGPGPPVEMELGVPTGFFPEDQLSVT